MKTQKFSVQLYVIFIAVIILMTLTPIFGITGSIWTTNSDGTQQDGNQYLSAKDVYLNVNLDKGDYYFQVTSTDGKTLLSTFDSIDERAFTVGEEGYIISVSDGHELVPLPEGGWSLP